VSLFISQRFITEQVHVAGTL